MGVDSNKVDGNVYQFSINSKDVVVTEETINLLFIVYRELFIENYFSKYNIRFKKFSKYLGRTGKVKLPLCCLNALLRCDELNDQCDSLKDHLRESHFDL